MSFPPGVFTKIFARPQLDEAFAAIAAHGLTCTQFNMACAGLPTLPDEIDQPTQDTIRSEFARYGIRMSAISGTFNMIHPDLKKRSADLNRLRTLIEACPGLGTRIVTLCSGTRHPDNMWRAHPDNHSPEAWRDLLASLEVVLPLAEAQGIFLAFEPELSNVIDQAARGRRLLDEARSPNLKVVIDAANLFHSHELNRIPQILRQAFDFLGSDIILAHAKDLNAAGEIVPAGQGVLDYNLYVSLLKQSGYQGPLILHSLAETQVAESAAFLTTFSKSSGS